MDNSLYYTFSTIAQSLAALMALLGAFALFRLQSIDNDLKEKASNTARTFAGHKDLNDHLAAENYEEFLVLLDKYTAGDAVSFHASELAKIDRLRALIPIRKSIVTSLKVAFLSSAIVMVTSVFVLTQVHNLPDAQWLLWLGAIGFLICLILQIRLVVTFLK